VRQTAVLAAIERRREATLPELWHDFPALVPSAIERVIQALKARGLVERDGDPERFYLGGVTFRPFSRGAMGVR
jgi:DNA-binding IclR family transcriptional regulator